MCVQVEGIFQAHTGDSLGQVVIFGLTSDGTRTNSWVNFTGSVRLLRLDSQQSSRQATDIFPHI